MVDEALERLLPYCDSSVFKVAKWLNDRAELGEIVILRDGEPVAPASIPSMLRVRGFVDSSGQMRLEVTPLDNFVPPKVWTFGREGFEKHCLSRLKGRRGRKPYDREKLVAAALTCIAIDGMPTGRDGKPKLDGRDGLFERLEHMLGAKELPERSTLYAIFNPIVEQIEAVRRGRQDKSLIDRKK